MNQMQKEINQLKIMLKEQKLPPLKNRKLSLLPPKTTNI